ncbi:MAG: 50S ribosomal protein L11 methyltransferase, partial [Gammaproteobacteria bacterium]|nr:50S ribosomal protein L11 methyltransferase [Gammaproteobacteria bacterium]
MATQSWLQVELLVSAEAVDAVETALGGLGALSVSLDDAGCVPILEPAPGTTPLWPQVRVTALLPAASERKRIGQVLRPFLLTATPDIRFSPVAERDWVREFREQLAPQRFGAKLWICPIGTPCPDPGGISVALEPGLAFGSGSHPTTALCLAWLAGLETGGAAVLDYGCGSGVLAVAALALGARSATALDIDPQALEATRENAVRNGVSPRLRVTHPEDLGPEERFDIVVANILADTLIDLAPILKRHCRTGARVALSGILASQAERVRLAC